MSTKFLILGNRFFDQNFPCALMFCVENGFQAELSLYSSITMNRVVLRLAGGLALLWRGPKDAIDD